MQGIHDNTAIVTGAASGIGRATAERFATAGANVVVADVDAEGGAETVASIEDDGGEATFVRTDVADPDDVSAMVETALDTYGSLELAHNNAGIGETGSNLMEMTEEEWDRTLDINLRGVWLCLREELRAMTDDEGGAIVNTASTAGELAHPTAGHYTAAKHGVLGLTKNAAFEFVDDDIRVNAVCPGMINTGLVDDPEEARAMAEARTPIARIGQPEEVADVVVRLCSSDASFLTGVGVPVDGGMLAGRVWGRAE